MECVLHRPFRDEQPIGDRWLPLGDNPCGAPRRVHEGIRAGQRGREY